MAKNEKYTNNVSTLRGKYGLTQEKFAEVIGSSESTIKKVESGERTLTPDVAIKIWEVYNVSLNWLYGLDDNFNDKAGDTVLALKHIFQLDMRKCVIKMDKRLEEFLLSLDKVESKKDDEIPEPAYRIWVDDIKRKFNDSMSSNGDNTPVEYEFFPKGTFDSQVKAATEAALNEKLKQHRPEIGMHR